MTIKSFSTSRAVVYAVLVHVGLIALLMVSLDWTPKVTPQPQPQVMQAVVIDDSALRARRAQKEAEQRREQLLAEERLKHLEEKRVIEEQKERAIQEQEKAAERRAAEIARKKQGELEQEKRKKQQESERQARLKKEKEAEAKKAQEASQRVAELEARRKTEAEQKRRAEEKRRIEAEEDALQEQLAAEQQRRDAERERLAKSALARYSGLIRQKVERNWLRPQTARPGMSCTVLVRLTAGGEVLLARVVESSGDTAFDRSVEAAVYRASPLPLPQDATLFEYFREINFVFKPEG